MWKITFLWSEMGSGFGETGGTPLPGFPRNTPPGLLRTKPHAKKVNLITWKNEEAADV